MKFKIKRFDGIEDDITSNIYETFDDAYDVLDKIYSDVCCSDADYEDRPYYEINEIISD